MPELPEVETVARELKQNILNRQFSEIDVFWKRSMDDRCGIPLYGQEINAVSRKGKYLILTLNESVLIIHLRMTGQLLFFHEEHEVQTHVRIRVRFSDGSELHFKDVRKFGRFYHVLGTDEVLKTVGIDAMAEEMDSAAFRTLLSKSSMNLKAFLLSQRYISGLGNIYVDESLFRSHLHPSLPASRLNRKQADGLYRHIRDVLTEAIDNMGSTISDYRDTYGNPGGNQNFFRVYGRAGKPCQECGAVVKKIRFAGRGTYYCPDCQKP